MGARKTSLSLTTDWRARIQTSMLINRLHDHVKGAVKLDKSQVSAAIALLKKTLPDLTSVEHSGEIEHNHIARLPSPSQEIDQWRDQQQSVLPRPLTQ